MVVLSSITIAGARTKLLAGDPSRVALIVFCQDFGPYAVGPIGSLAINGGLIQCQLAVPFIVKLRKYGDCLKWEWWYNGTASGTIQLLEVLEDL